MLPPLEQYVEKAGEQFKQWQSWLNAAKGEMKLTEDSTRRRRRRRAYVNRVHKWADMALRFACNVAWNELLSRRVLGDLADLVPDALLTAARVPPSTAGQLCAEPSLITIYTEGEPSFVLGCAIGGVATEWLRPSSGCVTEVRRRRLAARFDS